MDYYRALLLDINREPKEIDIPADYILDELQKLVGKNYVESVNLFAMNETDEFATDLIVNEHGKILGLPFNGYLNMQAFGYDSTELVDYIAGPAVIIGANDIEGEWQSLTDEQVEFYKDFFADRNLIHDFEMDYEYEYEL